MKLLSAAYVAVSFFTLCFRECASNASCNVVVYFQDRLDYVYDNEKIYDKLNLDTGHLYGIKLGNVTGTANFTNFDGECGGSFSGILEIDDPRGGPNGCEGSIRLTNYVFCTNPGGIDFDLSDPSITLSGDFKGQSGEMIFTELKSDENATVWGKINKVNITLDDP